MSQSCDLGRPRKHDTHLPPCVHFKHGSYYYVKDGWRPLGKTLPEALTEYAKLIEPPKQGAMGDLIDRVLNHVEPTLAENTIKQYRSRAATLKDILVEFDPQELRPKHIVAIKTKWSRKPNMGNQLLSLLRIVFKQALEWGEIELNPCIGIDLHKVSKRDRLLTPDEFGAIYTKADAQLQVIMELWMLTGQRVCDVIRIHRADLKPDGIEFVQQKTKAKLLIRWSPELRSAVDRAKTLNGNVQSLSLFRGKHGKPPAYSTIYAHWSDACKDAGVSDAQQRDLRAMAATHAKRQGLDPSALLGHKDKRTTEIYLRDKEIREVEAPSFRQITDSLKSGAK